MQKVLVRTARSWNIICSGRPAVIDPCISSVVKDRLFESRASPSGARAESVLEKCDAVWDSGDASGMGFRGYVRVLFDWEGNHMRPSTPLLYVC